MAYGLPAAIAAKLVHPDRQVVCLAGDGDFLMSCRSSRPRCSTSVPLVVVIFDNGMYGTIRMHQERHYPGRVSGTDLRNPDFAALAQAFGAHGERVETTAEAGPAIERALAAGRPGGRPSRRRSRGADPPVDAQRDPLRGARPRSEQRPGVSRAEPRGVDDPSHEGRRRCAPSEQGLSKGAAFAYHVYPLMKASLSRLTLFAAIFAAFVAVGPVICRVRSR